MTLYDRITADNWTVAFPSDWTESPDADGTLYFAAPGGDKGFYVSLWRMSDEETRGSLELIEAFQRTELGAHFPADEYWVLISRESAGDETSATGYWEGVSEERMYWISGKQIARGKFVLRSTFHDYDSPGSTVSTEYFSTIVGSLGLCAV